ncbi:MAG: PAS domain S-box protein [Candidatus Neomarinimicrobiota bacterium]|nr:MAG: PAS domain S-box protein [Candidatus Neomarinimicrobiota bacterium]
MAPEQTKQSYLNPRHLLLVMLLAVFSIEGIIMILLPQLGVHSLWTEALIDGGLLSAVLFPVIYLVFFRPLVNHIRERERAEEALKTLHGELEERVRQRTQELHQLNKSLTEEIEVRTQVEEELRKLTQAVEQSSASIVITDTRGRIEYVNPKFTRLTGYTFQEAVGKNPRILKSGLQPKSFYENLWNTITSGKEWRGEFGNRKKNGEIYWESATIAPVKSANGKITHFVAVKDDITRERADQEALKKSEQELRQLTTKLTDANNLKTLLLDILTHDLKNPAGVIMGLAEVLRNQYPGDEMVETVFNSSTSLLQVIDNATALAGISMEEQIQLETLDLVPMIHESAREFESILQAKGLTLEFDLPERLLAEANPILAEVFKNYLSNAIKYAAEGKTFLFRGSVEDFLIEVALVDYGQTIPEADREKIFTRSIQLENGHRKGRGLGLAIVRKIAEAHGAVAGVRPNEPTGNCFFLQIPESGKPGQ